MTGREREALERRVRSLILKMNDLTFDLKAAGAGRHVGPKLEDAALALGGLLQGELRPGTLGGRRYRQPGVTRPRPPRQEST
jgi:hypothetical protein